MNYVPDGVHRMFQLTQRGPREEMGYPIDFRCGCEQQGLCSPAKETPARGETFGLRWCPPVPPALSRAFPARPAQGHKIRKGAAFAT